MSFCVKLIAATAFALASIAAQAVIPIYPNAGTENTALYTFTAAATGRLQAYFADSTATYEEELGLKINGIDSDVVGQNNNRTANNASISFGNVTADDLLTLSRFLVRTRRSS